LPQVNLTAPDPPARAGVIYRSDPRVPIEINPYLPMACSSLLAGMQNARPVFGLYDISNSSGPSILFCGL
jgi:hypothetical protein